MDVIDNAFSQLSSFTKSQMPEGIFTSLLSEGIIPGVGGIVIFIPQIAFLFMFIFFFRRKWIYESSSILNG